MDEDVPKLPIGKWMVVDTETSDLPDWKLPADHISQPRLAHLVILFLDQDLNVVNTYDEYIKPDGWAVRPEAQRVNNLSNEMLAERGVPVREALDAYLKAIDDGYCVIAFGAQFDCKIMRGEARRAGLDDRFERTKNFCVMRKLTGVCRLPNPKGRGGYKWPKLAEAHDYFFKYEPARQHTAAGDAYTCLKLLRKMVEIGIRIEPEVHYAKERPTADAGYRVVDE